MLVRGIIPRSILEVVGQGGDSRRVPLAVERLGDRGQERARLRKIVQKLGPVSLRVGNGVVLHNAPCS